MMIKFWDECSKEMNSPSGEMQIWSASFAREKSSDFIHLLSVGELKRAERLKNKSVARKQIISRGILRRLLGNYLGINPKELVFKNDRFGKPVLITPADSPFYFNLSHSGDLLLIAIGRAGQVGIDVEKIEKNRQISGIAAMVFSAEEQKALTRSLNPVRHFHTLWTAKEAILKCAGRGFSYPSSHFSVSIPKGFKSLSNIPDELTGGLSCRLSSFSPVPGYAAAVAVLHQP